MDDFQIKRDFPSLRDRMVTGAEGGPQATGSNVPTYRRVEGDLTRPAEPTPAPPSESFSTPGGVVSEPVPVKSLPTWVDDVAKATRPEENLSNIKLLRDVISGKKLYTTTVKSEKTSAWAKNVLKRLEADPERAVELIDAIEQRLRGKTEFPKTKGE